MCLAQGPQRSDAGEAQTRGPSVSSQALYHCTPSLPWLNQYLSLDKCIYAPLLTLLKDHNAVTLVKLEPEAPLSRVKHSTTEPLRSPDHILQL